MRLLSRRTFLRTFRDSDGRLFYLVSIMTSCLHQARLDLTVKHGVFNVALVCVCRKCEGGSWQVFDDSACPIRCITSGVSHVITFDNKDYDYSGSCMYVLARDVDLAAFEILIENMLCGATGAICQKKITLRVRDANEEWNEYLLESVWHKNFVTHLTIFTCRFSCHLQLNSIRINNVSVDISVSSFYQDSKHFYVAGELYTTLDFTDHGLTVMWDEGDWLVFSQ